MVTTEQAAALAHVHARTIFQWVECGRVHYIENPAGRLLICLNSLSFND
jgi:predicted site-specific integrase-resolvase